MVLLEQFYYLNAQKHEKISSLWKAVPVILIILGTSSGLGYSVIFGSIHKRFIGRCIFFSSFYGKLYNNTNETLHRHENFSEHQEHLKFLSWYEIQWYSNTMCDFMQYTPFFCSIFGLILLTLVFMCGKGGNDIKNGLHKSWKIVVPGLVITLIFSLLCLVISLLFAIGLNEFCHNYRRLYGETSCSDTVNIVSKAVLYDYKRERQAIKKYFYGHVDDTYDFYEVDNLLYYADTSKIVHVAKLLLNITMSAWFACVFVFVLRILWSIDFTLIKFTIRSCEIISSGYALESEESNDLLLRKIHFNGETKQMNDIEINEDMIIFSESPEAKSNRPIIKSTEDLASFFGVDQEKEQTKTEYDFSLIDIDKIMAFKPEVLINISPDKPEDVTQVTPKPKTMPTPQVLFTSEFPSRSSSPSSWSDKDKSVQFNKSNLETIYSTKVDEAEDEAETETEMVTYSPTHSTVTLASPEPSDDSVELIEYNKESPEKKKKNKKVTIV